MTLDRDLSNQAEAYAQKIANNWVNCYTPLKQKEGKLLERTWLMPVRQMVLRLQESPLPKCGTFLWTFLLHFTDQSSDNIKKTHSDWL